MTVSKGRDTYAATHGRAASIPDTDLVKTALGRGHLRRRAINGDTTARDLLREHGVHVGEERAAYDDLSGGGSHDD